MTTRLNRSQSEIRYASDPYCQLERRKCFDRELNTIRLQSRSIWARPDTSLTTHGHFFADPEQKQRTSLRPTSAGRRHNPHPKLVFMRTGMRDIPNAYGAPPARPLTRQEIIRTPSVPNYLEQLGNLTPVERQGANAFLKSANDDSKKNVLEAIENYRILMANEYECPPIGAAVVSGADGSRTEFYPSMERYRQVNRNEKDYPAVAQVLADPSVEVKITDNQPPPVIYKRNVRYANRGDVHFQREEHSHSKCPWPLARRPYRGDFSIHYDWHPRLPHHRLSCLC